MSETCYGHSSPNAVFLPNYGPCNPQQGSISLCCETGETCLTNGLCVTQSGVYYNGGCTDSTYKAAICPTFCTLGDANWVIECQGAAVNNGDFCCSVNGTTTTCCSTASNGLGLVAAVSSAQAVSATFAGANIVPTSISSGPIASSLGSVTSSLTSSSLPTATSQPHGSQGMPGSKKAEISIVAVAGVVALCVAIIYVRYWIRRCLARRRALRPAGPTIVELNDLREGSNKSGPQAQPSEGVVSTEVEGSPVGPVEMDANQPHGAATSPPIYDDAAYDGAADSNSLQEPPATPVSW